MGQDDNEKDRSAQETLSFAEVLANGQRVDPSDDRPHLIVSEPGKEQYLVTITRNPTIVGHSANADVVLDDPAASDFHARIIKHSFGYTVEDMGSAEGTYLQERRVSHARIVNGDIFRVGSTILTFLDESARNTSHETRGVYSPSAGSVPNKSTAIAPIHRPRALVDQRPPIRRFPTPVPPPIINRPRSAQEEGENEQSIEDVVLKLVRVYRYLKPHALFISVFLVLGTALGAASFRFLPPIQGAFTLITLHSEFKNNPIDPESRIPQQETPQSFFLNAVETIGSSAVVAATLKGMGVQNPPETLAEAIVSRMKVEQRGKDTYLATFKPRMFDRGGLNPVLFLSKHINTYIDLEISKKLKAFVAEVEFLRIQTDTADTAVKRVADELVKFREAHADQLLAQGNLVAGSPASLETRRIDLAGEVQRLTGELNGIRSQMARGSALENAKTQSTVTYRDRLTKMTQQIAELRAQGYADGHPDIQKLLAEQQSLQQIVDDKHNALATTSEIKTNVQLDTLKAQADQVESRLRAASTQYGFVESNLRTIRKVSALSPEINAKLDELLRQKDEAVKQHSLLFDRLKKAEIRLELERVSAKSRVEIDIPAKLEAPPRKKALAARIFIGFGIGLGVALLVLGYRALRDLVKKVAQNAELTTLVLLAAGLATQGCAHPGNFTWAKDLPQDTNNGEQVIQPRDTILVEVQKQAALSGEHVVRDDGHFLQPMVGSIRVADTTPGQAAMKISASLKEVIVNPIVSVWITKTSPIKVSVVGEVKTPGTYEFTRNKSLAVALAAAGWVTDFASKDGVFVLRGDGSRIRFTLRDIKSSERATTAFRLNDADIIVVE